MEHSGTDNLEFRYCPVMGVMVEISNCEEIRCYMCN